MVIFLYLKNKIPVRAVFDICHYEAVGRIDRPSPLLPKNKGPQFQVWRFYRGILPVRDARRYEFLTKELTPLDPHQLKEWWKGVTSEGDCKKEAKFEIIKKLEEPFQEILTFRDSESILGFLIDAYFKARRKEEGILGKELREEYDEEWYEIERLESGGYRVQAKHSKDLFGSRSSTFSKPDGFTQRRKKKGDVRSGRFLVKKYKRKDRPDVLVFKKEVSPLTVDSYLDEKAHEMSLPNGEKLNEQNIKEFIEFMEKDILGEPRARKYLIRNKEDWD